MYVCKVDGDMYSWHNLDGVYLIFTRWGLFMRDGNDLCALRTCYARGEM